MLALCVSIGTLAVVAHASAQWVDPTTPIPGVGTSGGAEESPLTTGSSAQTKTGPLTVWKSFSVMGDLSIAGQLCWNGTSGVACRSGWQSANVGNYVRLQTDTLRDNDYGFVSLRNPDVAVSEFTLQGIAAMPTDSSAVVRAGVVGRAAHSDAGYSYGVVGSAGSFDLADHYGVYATNGGNRDTLAAQFNGNVAFVGLPGESDLVVGTLNSAVQTARLNTLSEVCLNGDCRSNWDTAGPTPWVVTSSTLWPGLISRGVSIGNDTFKVTLPTSTTADMTVTGDVSVHKMVVGTPSSNLISWATCGDNICSTGETPALCPDDCDTTPPDQISSITVRGLTEGIIELTWHHPSSIDFAGTRILITDGIHPSSPSDGTPIDVAGIHDGISIKTFGPFSHGKIYFWLYSYDLNRHSVPLNFSLPVGYEIDL